ncbi:DUF2855 family protein [Shewanella inventionis]|uniref:DUF2855 family protein n=1 Tax=Shewanella inventionis TaxID=1738770 RepID=A0ABQ1JHE9_9GAMM|nr:DUF2855 family protein [Shewanella inventionis]MCL1158395.1 DUF2855 family protein [Shewanella inventionis]UAL41750.1 DUF2855 family protein [Shewanella inventionis]GGB68460.1 hypothetical protein GCM10011607_31360 [Shewanella inventionis]
MTTDEASHDAIPKSATVFEVNKHSLQNTRVNPLAFTAPMAHNDVLLRVDKFALTANNISYGIMGDSLGYWRFFPSTDPVHWGRLPVMGYAEVIKSKNDQILVGERVWGFMPMASHFMIVAGNVSQNSFSDISPCREGLSPLYSRFDRVNANPFYLPQNEDYDILLRGLFTTSWLINDYMSDNQYFGAEQYLITSASSKTSIALAFCIKQQAQRPVIGVTSNENKAFVASLGCYDKVISYDQVSQLDTAATILVDMAGSKTTLALIHHHFSEQLKYSCRIGLTHHQDIDINDNNTLLPGPVPSFFFAPSQLAKRSKEHGATATMTLINTALLGYIDFCKNSISIAHINDFEAIDPAYQAVLAGQANASVGIVVHPNG